MLKTLLICHDGARVDREVLAPWLASFSDLVGLVTLEEGRQNKAARARRELRRVGAMRFADVAAFRLYYRLFRARKDAAWEATAIEAAKRRFGPVRADLPVLRTADPNGDETVDFLRKLEPDIVIARCKTILDERVFSVARHGTFVMHPGITPEYRNSHGCFWALANRDLGRVGMTLIKIDAGVDTGPVYGYYSYDFDEASESHAVIQKRVVLENLDALAEKLLAIGRGDAAPVETSGRSSRAWGQPWLTSYAGWRRAARRRTMRAASLLYHDVVEEGRYDSSGFPGRASARYKLERAAFDEHLDALTAETGRAPESVDELPEHAGVGSLPWLLTFDDGGSSALDIGERLQARGWRGHFFVTGAYVGTPGFLAVEEIRELHRMGHIIGSHSYSHPKRMPALGRDDLIDEWERSASLLATILGEPIRHASVPAGYYHDRVAHAAASAGIKWLFTSEPVTGVRTVGGCHVVGRFAIVNGTKAGTAARLAAGEPLPRMQQLALWNTKKLLKAAAGDTYLRVRRAVVSRTSPAEHP
jgi:peptidoglycan/xylan/chitin deacetylase (PgdA/CDA1 family)/folate-dependent phosphoribosylglycinamide formyltransferase PurN